MTGKMNLIKEKEIQLAIQERLTRHGFHYNILDEEYKDLKLNQSHKYLLIDSFTEDGVNIFKGLRHHIEKHNKHIIEEFNDKIEKEKLIDLIMSNFIERWNAAKSNVDYYNLVFKSGYCTIDIKTGNGKNVIRNYNVISFGNFADNEYTIIKEKRMIGVRGLEQPDFAMYINGIPLIVWEVKTKQSTLKKALTEYGTKSTYSKFILCLGTDGEDAFLTGSTKLYFLWKKYGKNITSRYIFDIEKFINSETPVRDDIEYIQNLIISNIPRDSNKFTAMLSVIEKYRNNGNIKILSENNIAEFIFDIITHEPGKKFGLINSLKECIINPTTGLEDLIEELFDQPENLLFYFKYSVLTDKTNKEYGDYEFLINHRVQQYYTIKLLNRKLKKIQRYDQKNSGETLLSELVKHVQRSGKSITIRSAVNLIADNFKDLFSKLYVCVPDLTILNVMLNTFNNNSLKVKRIRSRGEFVRSIKEQSKGFTCYLYNIQKTKDPDSIEPDDDDFKNISKYIKNDVLFIIDEVHFSQNKTQAAVRANCFPNASFLTFTATPKIKTKNGEIINDTAIRYADTDNEGSIQYLDELNATEAIKMGIILPVVYESMVFEQSANLEIALEFDEKTKEMIDKFLSNTEYSIKIKSEQDLAEQKLRYELEPKKDDNLTEEVIQKQIAYVRESILNKYKERVLREIEKEEKFSALRSLRAEKIKYVISDLKGKTETCFSEGRIPSFRAKAFYVVESKKDAEAYIKIVKELSGNNTNVVNGYRFGVDFSEDQVSTSDLSLLVELNDLSPNDKVIKKFEAQNEKDDPVDILFIVNKYLMGYDNKELVAVYCDKVIREPAKLYQLITRSATTRSGKKQGFFVDLVFGNDNYNTYVDQCLPYYNNNSETSISTLTKEEILIQKERLNGKMADIKNLLGYSEQDILLDEIEIYNRLLSKNNIIDTSYVIKKKRDYFNHFREINEIMDILINPKYYMSNFDEILILSKVNSRYLAENCPKVAEDTEFNRDDIKAIIIKSLSFFGFHDLEEINNFKISHTNIKDEKLSGKIYFNNIVTDFKQLLTLDRSSAPKGFTDMINNWSEKIMTEKDAKLAINQLNENFIDPYNKKRKERVELIKKEFNSSVAWYIANKAIEKSLALIDENSDQKSTSLINSEFDLFLPEFCRFLSDKIAFKINEIIGVNKSTLEKKEFYLKKLMSDIVFNLTELNDFNVENLPKTFKSAFIYDTKKLSSLLKSGIGISNEAHQYLNNNSNSSMFIAWFVIALEDYYIELINKTIDLES